MNSEDGFILVVDDEPANIHLLSGILKGSYKLKAATSGQKALDIALKYDDLRLVLLDMMMPEMDGLTVLKSLKKDTKLADIPVIIISGLPEAADHEEALRAGAAAFIGKPVNSTELLELIDSI